MCEARNHLPIHSDAVRIGGWDTLRVRFSHDGFCTIQTSTGNYLTAVGGGGVGAPANHPVATDRTGIQEWETFTMERVGQGLYAFKTPRGTYLNAVGGGGKGEAANKLPLHTDASKAQAWEKFILV